MRSVWLFVLLVATPARADDALGVRVRKEAEHAPWLELDPAVLAPVIEGLGATRQTERTVIDLDPRTQLTAISELWANREAELPMLDTPARGWRAGLQLAHDFGFARLVIMGSLNELDSQLGGRARYVDVGLWFGRTFKLSRWMTAWIAISFGERIWLGEAPAGELGGRQAMLSIGTTFR